MVQSYIIPGRGFMPNLSPSLSEEREYPLTIKGCGAGVIFSMPVSQKDSFNLEKELEKLNLTGSEARVLDMRVIEDPVFPSLYSVAVDICPKSNR